MLALRDQVVIAVKLISDEDIDGVRVGEFLELLAQFLRLAIGMMLVITGIVNTLNAWADSFWDAWDTLMMGPRWRLCPVTAVPLG